MGAPEVGGYLPAPLLLGLLLTAALLTALWAYPRTTGLAGRVLRRVLIGLRVLSVVTVALLLAGLTLTWRSVNSRRPRIALLVDASRSMGSDAALLAARARLAPALPDEIDFSFWSFSRSLRETSLREALEGPFDGDRSDIAAAFNDLLDRTRSRPPDRILLISDGRRTGTDPVRVVAEGRIPVDVLADGPPAPTLGVTLESVIGPDRAYAGRPSSVEVRFSSMGSGGDRLRIDLIRAGISLADSTLVLSGRGALQSARLRWIPADSGEVILEVRLTAANGQETGHTFTVEVRSARRRVLLLAGFPDAETGYLRRTLSSDADLEVTVHTRLAPGTWSPPLPDLPDSTDVLVLDRTPSSSLPAGFLDAAAGRAASGSLGLMVRPDAGPSGGVADLLPARPTGALTPGPLRVRPARVEGVSAPTFLDAEAAYWRGLPTLPAAPEWFPEPGAVTLIEGVGSSGRTPLLVVRAGAGRIALLTAPDVRSWESLTWGTGGDGSGLTRIWSGLIHWLAERDGGRLTIRADPPVVSQGDPIRFEGWVYDEAGRPLAGVEVDVTLYTERDGSALDARKLDRTYQPGFHTGSFGPRSPGAYYWEATARQGGTAIGEAEGRVAVDPLDPEVRFLGRDSETLAALAAAAGGRLGSIEGAAEFLQGLPREQVADAGVKTLALWPLPGGFLLLVLLLVAEWVLRRRAGML